MRSSAIIGAFATDLQIQTDNSGTKADPGMVTVENRLFAPVRGDATLTWADVGVDDPGQPLKGNSLPASFAPFVLDCGQPGNGTQCDSVHRTGNPPDPADTRLATMPGEPFGMAQSQDGSAIAVTHQTSTDASLLLAGNAAPHEVDPSMQFVETDVVNGGSGITFIPHDPNSSVPPCPPPPPPGDAGMASTPAGMKPCVEPAFLETSHGAAQIDLLRYYSDDGSSLHRPFIAKEAQFDLNTNLGGTDSRGIAIDPTPRLTSTCGDAMACGDMPARVFIANRTPPSLVIGEIGGISLNGDGSYDPDQLTLTGNLPLPAGPSRVYVAPIVNPQGNFEVRVFIVNFDSSTISVYDPNCGAASSSTSCLNLALIDTIYVGPGPFAMAFDPFTLDEVAKNAHVESDKDRQTDPTLRRYRFGYVASFTESYVQVINLNQFTADVRERRLHARQSDAAEGFVGMRNLPTMGLALAALAVAAAVSGSSCSQTPTNVPIRTFEGAQRVAVVCLQVLNVPNPTLGAVPVTQDNCAPVASGVAPDTVPYHLMAAVTQTTRGELAIVDLTGGYVVDEDQSTPGTNFIPVGTNPTDVAIPPSGDFTYVASAAATKPAIYAIDSRRLLGDSTQAATPQTPPLKLTDLAACSLPQPPLALAIAALPPASGTDGGGVPGTDGGGMQESKYGLVALLGVEGNLPAKVVTINPSSFIYEPTAEHGSLPACTLVGSVQLSSDLPPSWLPGPPWPDGVPYVDGGVDLDGQLPTLGPPGTCSPPVPTAVDGGVVASEAGAGVPDATGGVVTNDAALPEEGGPDAGLTDAGLEDAGLEDGEVEAAAIEEAGVAPPGVAEAGAMVAAADAGAEDAGIALAAAPSSTPNPSSMVMRDDLQLLYVADQALPLIHVIDVSNLNAPREIEPLLATSVTQPTRLGARRGAGAQPADSRVQAVPLRDRRGGRQLDGLRRHRRRDLAARASVAAERRARSVPPGRPPGVRGARLDGGVRAARLAAAGADRGERPVEREPRVHGFALQPQPQGASGLDDLQRPRRVLPGRSGASHPGERHGPELPDPPARRLRVRDALERHGRDDRRRRLGRALPAPGPDGRRRDHRLARGPRARGGSGARRRVGPRPVSRAAGLPAGDRQQSRREPARHARAVLPPLGATPDAIRVSRSKQSDVGRAHSEPRGNAAAGGRQRDARGDVRPGRHREPASPAHGALARLHRSEHRPEPHRTQSKSKRADVVARAGDVPGFRTLQRP